MSWFHRLFQRVETVEPIEAIEPHEWTPWTTETKRYGAVLFRYQWRECLRCSAREEVSLAPGAVGRCETALHPRRAS